MASKKDEETFHKVLGELDYLWKVEDAAIALAHKIEAVQEDPQYKSVWTVAMIHGCKYDGPQYGEELKKLKDIFKTKNSMGLRRDIQGGAKKQ